MIIQMKQKLEKLYKISKQALTINFGKYANK